MTFDELKDKALSLPFAPGVYIMRNKDDKVIYVGKAKKLKNRVSQYFQDSASHTVKTRQMVSQIDHFDTVRPKENALELLETELKVSENKLNDAQKNSEKVEDLKKKIIEAEKLLPLYDELENLVEIYKKEICNNTKTQARL